MQSSPEIYDCTTGSFERELFAIVPQRTQKNVYSQIKYSSVDDVENNGTVCLRNDVYFRSNWDAAFHEPGSY